MMKEKPKNIESIAFEDVQQVFSVDYSPPMVTMTETDIWVITTTRE